MERRRFIGIGTGAVALAAVPALRAEAAGTRVPTATVVDHRRVRISWPAYPGATGYIVGRTSDDGDDWHIRERAGARTRVFLDLEPGQRYRVYYRPVGGDGRGVKKSVYVTAAAAPAAPPPPPPPPPHGTTRSKAVQLLGTPRSGLPWHSGAWTGGRFTTSQIVEYGSWRGRPTDVVTTYSPNNPGDTFQAMMSSTWSIGTWDGFPGKLIYGIAPLPPSGEGSMRSIAAGAQDGVWRAMANNLARGGRQDSVVRIAWECNLPDWRHGATASTAADYRAMFRRVASVMKDACPTLVIDWGLAVGSGLSGARDRLAPLTELYPGDDVVDIIHGDTYDFYATQVRGNDSAGLYRTPTGVGLDDLSDFARAHGKGLGLGEWGLHRIGGGDNPAFIRAVWAWCERNADQLVYESYFDEPADYIRNSLNTGQNTQAASQYCQLW